MSQVLLVNCAKHIESIGVVVIGVCGNALALALSNAIEMIDSIDVGGVWRDVMLFDAQGWEQDIVGIHQNPTNNLLRRDWHEFKEHVS